MEIHRQQCQRCQGYDMRNILVREAGKPAAVYVRCAKCLDLVARYKLSEYYHHGKGVESFLRSMGSGGGDSARQFQREFERAQRESVEGFEAALEHLKEEHKDDG